MNNIQSFHNHLQNIKKLLAIKKIYDPTQHQAKFWLELAKQDGKNAQQHWKELKKSGISTKNIIIQIKNANSKDFS